LHQLLHARRRAVEAARKKGRFIVARFVHPRLEVALTPALHPGAQGVQALGEAANDGVAAHGHSQGHHRQHQQQAVGAAQPGAKGRRRRHPRTAGAHARWAAFVARAAGWHLGTRSVAVQAGPLARAVFIGSLARRHVQDDGAPVFQRHGEFDAMPGHEDGSAAGASEHLAGLVAQDDLALTPARARRRIVVIGAPQPGKGQGDDQHHPDDGQPDAQVQRQAAEAARGAGLFGHACEVSVRGRCADRDRGRRPQSCSRANT
jgi:hypothetical protein